MMCNISDHLTSCIHVLGGAKTVLSAAKRRAFSLTRGGCDKSLIKHRSTKFAKIRTYVKSNRACSSAQSLPDNDDRCN